MKTVKVNVEDLGKETAVSNPVLNRCKELLKEGTPKNTRVEFFRENKLKFDFAVTNLGEYVKCKAR